MKILAPILVIFALLAETFMSSAQPNCGPRGEIKVVQGEPLCFHKPPARYYDNFD